MEVAELLERARPAVMAEQRKLPLAPSLTSLLPGGLRRGMTVSVGGAAGATSLLLALVAEASAGGSWCALVGLPDVGPEAAAAMGVDLGRLVLVPDPGERWAVVVSTLLEGVELVVLRPERSWRARPVEARRLAASARRHSSVLVTAGSSWPESCDLALEVSGARWEGLGQGYGSLLSRRLEVSVGGRRAASRRRRANLWLPAESGRAEPVDDTVVPLAGGKPAGGGAGAPAVRRSRGAGDPAGRKPAGGGAGAPAVRRSRGAGDPAGGKH